MIMLWRGRNQNHHTTIRIGINAHLLSGSSGYRRAGIHNYIYQVINNLPLAAENWEYTVFLPHQAPYDQKTGFKSQRSRWPTDRRIVRILWEQSVWPILANIGNFDLLHSMAFVLPIIGNTPSVVTVYDLSFIHYPENFPKLQQAYLRSQTNRSCRKARRIITISHSSRQDVHNFFQIPLEKIDVVVPGVDSIYHPLPAHEVEAFREEKGFSKNLILHVGTLQPRKNIPLLLRAVAEMGHLDVDLVLIGGKGWHYEQIFDLVVQLDVVDRVHFLGYVPDEELPIWYNLASLLAFPSAYEGFGLPIVEAMACGTPVVAARSSSIPEAGGEAALYFNPGNVEELAKQMTAIFESPQLAEDLREAGLKQAGRFSWQRAGWETARVYQRALGLA